MSDLVESVCEYKTNITIKSIMQDKFNKINSNTSLTRKLLAWIHLFVFVGMIPIAGNATEVVTSTLANNIHVTALYNKGREDRPAILIIHGFLQTRNYQTVNSLSNSLSEDNYTVLAPTLSLGVSLRKQSLACEAVHTHTMHDDVREIDHWVNWLVAQGHKRIIMVGHSYGSLQNLVYASGNPDASVKKIIATSLVDVEHVLSKEHVQQQIKTAREKIKNRNMALNEFQISYCKKFISPPNVFLSYAEWTKERILESLRISKIQVEVILGNNDKRMGEGWPKLIKETGTEIRMVEGANHFFNDAHEFDLLDLVQNSIELNETRK